MARAQPMRTPSLCRTAYGWVASCLLSLGAGAFAETVTNTNDSGPGSLRQVIADAAPGANIDFDPALSGQSIALTSGNLVINKNLTVDASGLTNRVTINGGGISRVLSINAGVTVALRNLIITGGKTPDATTFKRDGGGILAMGNLTLERCDIVGNATGAGGSGAAGVNAGYGGAICSEGSSLVLTDCAIDGNRTGDGGSAGIGGRGGALYLAGTGTLIMNRCSLSENLTGQGGNTGGPGGSGGGILNEDYAITITNSTLAGNVCGDGAASGNSAGGNGGAIYNENGTLNIQYSTLAGNASGASNGTGTLSRGGGIFNNEPASGLTITNTIVANNTAPGTGNDIQGPYTVAASNIVEDDSQAPTGGTPLVGDPALSSLGQHGGPTRTMRLLPGSIAVDRAVGPTIMTDQRGNPRGDFGLLDLGAYEAGGGSIVVNTTLDENNGMATGGVSLRDALAEGEAYSIITFDPVVFSGPNPTIELLHRSLVIFSPLTVDASALPRRVTLDARGLSSVMQIQSTGAVLLQNLGIVNGNEDYPYTGGGLNVIVSSVTLVNCLISGNTAENLGGGIFLGGNTLTLTSCTIFQNSAKDGGGIYASGQLTLTNSTVSGNSATEDGGGIYNQSLLTITSSTVSGNTSPSGSGVFNSAPVYIVTNSIVAGNIGGNSSAPTQQFGYNMLSGDPRLAPLGDYGGLTETMPPLPGSPAIDAVLGGVVATDQRGLIRPIDGDGNGSLFGDIGAAELTPSSDLAHFWPLDFDGDGIPFGVEHALGLDPLAADTAHAKNLSLPTFNGNGAATLTFGVNAAAGPHTIWVLRRSLDLQSWQEAYRFDGPSMMHIPQTGFTGGFDNVLNPAFFVVTELDPPPRAFYRFEPLVAPLP